MNNDPKKSQGEKKTPLQLIPPIINQEMAKALHIGNQKYGPWNWRNNEVEVMTYIGAIRRHCDQFLEGENTCSESKVHHLGHIAANCAIILDAQSQGTLQDNRP